MKPSVKTTIFILVIMTVIMGIFITTAGCESSETKYKQACDLLKEGREDEAYEILTSLNGYSDSMKAAEEIFNSKYLKALQSAKVGDIITFGNYEQDNNYTDGEEYIEWKVLEKSEDRLLIISLYILDCVPYDTSDKELSWETSGIRRWLNRSFLRYSFDEIELSRIEKTYLSSSSQMTDDPDYVFLLSDKEANKYFKEMIELRCTATKFAEFNGVYSDEDYPYACSWWLRTIGTDGGNNAMCVLISGKITTQGALASNDFRGVRPVMWIYTGDSE